MTAIGKIVIPRDDVVMNGGSTASEDNATFVMLIGSDSGSIILE